MPENRTLQKLAHDREMLEAYGAKGSSVLNCVEDPSTGATKQLPSGAELLKSSNIFAIILASGTSQRFASSNGIPKQYQKIGNKPIILRTIEVFIKNPNIEKVIVVIHKEHKKFYEEAVGDLVPTVFGGDTRQQSVRSALCTIAHLNPQKVIIHDAVRPFVTDQQINDVISALDKYDVVDSVLPVTDTIRMIGYGDFKALDRDILYKVQTPQGFRYPIIASIHEKFAGSSSFTDDVGMCLGLANIGAVKGSRTNIKITYQEDMISTHTNIIRTGIGFDVHRFSDIMCETTILICGVHIAHNRKVEAHSDGDVGLHAITEAILGSIAEGNIGTHFSPQDPQWKNADSKLFIGHANNLLKSKGGVINNIDVTIICEAPKIMIHSIKMRQNIAELLSISLDQVSVKATTTEKIGFLGRKEGISAQAICTISMPCSNASFDIE